MLYHIGRAVRFASVLSLSLFAAGWVSPAQAQFKLQYKLEEGKKTVVHTNLKSKQTLMLAGMNLESESDKFVISKPIK